jgi:hypothetical protein
MATTLKIVRTIIVVLVRYNNNNTNVNTRKID